MQFDQDGWDPVDPSDLIDLPRFFADTISRHDAVFDIDYEVFQDEREKDQYYDG